MKKNHRFSIKTKKTPKTSINRCFVSCKNVINILKVFIVSEASKRLYFSRPHGSAEIVNKAENDGVSRVKSGILGPIVHRFKLNKKQLAHFYGPNSINNIFINTFEVFLGIFNAIRIFHRFICLGILPCFERRLSADFDWLAPVSRPYRNPKLKICRQLVKQCE